MNRDTPLTLQHVECSRATCSTAQFCFPDDPINEYDDIAAVSGHTGGIRPPVDDQDDLQEDIYDTVTEVHTCNTADKVRTYT